jgi:hypothetical protein
MRMLLSLIITIVILFATYFNIRNYMVHDVVLEWNNRCHYKCVKYIRSEDPKDDVAEYYQKMWDDISSISYESMLYSFKPLSMEYWLTKEQIEFLTSE